jgi:phospholipase C
LREVWGLGPAFSGRDAVARTFEHVLNRDTPRPPDTWPEVTAAPVPAFQVEQVAARLALSELGRHVCHGLLHHAKQADMSVPAAPSDPDAEISPELALECVHWIGARMFPQLSS